MTTAAIGLGLVAMMGFSSVTLVGCWGGSRPTPMDASADGAYEDASVGDAGMPTVCGVSVTEATIGTDQVDDVDLLLVVDGSGSMADEQAALAEELPRIMSILASGDRDGDGDQDFSPARDLHVGVVTTDMGAGGFDVSFADSGTDAETACIDPSIGDDGLLRTVGNTSISGCMALYPEFLQFRPDTGADPTVFARDVACVARVGTESCGYEQPLESMLKALTPSTSHTAFAHGSPGHGDGANAGFLRLDSLLAILVITDEDDCSAADLELFNPSSSTYSGEPNLRCSGSSSALHSVERYVDGILALRGDGARTLLAVVAGVPPELVEGSDFIDYDAILADERMQETIDAEDPGRLRPSCGAPGVGVAFPPRRLVRLAQQLEAAGASATLRSICQPGFASVVDPVVGRISGRIDGWCVPRVLAAVSGAAVSQTLVGCDVIERLPAGGICATRPGRELLRVDGDREVCRVTQLPVTDETRASGLPPEGDGWYYDDYTTDAHVRCGSDGQRLSYVPGGEPTAGTEVHVECAQAPAPGRTVVGSSCDETECGFVSLACDPATNTCQRPCGDGVECDTTGLVGWSCGAAGFCVNPSCE